MLAKKLRAHREVRSAFRATYRHFPFVHRNL
jgi:hypothetical protein